MLVKDVVNIIEQLAPPSLAEGWDNVGLLVGDGDAVCKKILFALDATDEVIAEAAAAGADMIVTHHPIIFKGVNALNTSTALGRRLLKLVKNDIAVYCAHTSLDIAQGGTNDILAQLIGLKDVQGLMQTENGMLGRVGDLEEKTTLKALTNKLIKALGMPAANVTGSPETEVIRVGLCTGSGADRDFMLAAKNALCDVYITGDVKYHEAQFAQDIGLCLIDATHYYTESIAMPRVCAYVREHSGLECVVTDTNGESFKTVTADTTGE